MAAPTLSQRDINVLGKIRDPEASPAAALRLDPSLPKDPHVTDADRYARVSQRERELVRQMQQLEDELPPPAPTQPRSQPFDAFRQCVADLGALIDANPDYASARNNRAQALRRLYGDTMLLPPVAAEAAVEAADRLQAAATALSDLDRAVALLLPRNALFALSAPALSPTAAKTLSLAFTQRAAIYHATAKHMAEAGLDTIPRAAAAPAPIARPEARWTRFDFEEAASRDFAMGGRFGNEIARGLAVGTNPTAKLCGQIVQKMLKKEYGPSR